MLALSGGLTAAATAEVEGEQCEREAHEEEADEDQEQGGEQAKKPAYAPAVSSMEVMNLQLSSYEAEVRHSIHVLLFSVAILPCALLGAAAS
jgi:hypothetical protein